MTEPTDDYGTELRPPPDDGAGWRCGAWSDNSQGRCNNEAIVVIVGVGARCEVHDAS